MINNPIIYKFVKGFTNHRKKTNRALNTGTTDEFSQKSEKQDSFRHILKSSASMYEVQAHTSLEPPLEYNQDQMPLTNKGSLWPC